MQRSLSCSRLRSALVSSMMITPEAGNDSMLRNSTRASTCRRARRASGTCSGLHSTWFFMLGGPGETRATVDETLRFVKEELSHPKMLSVFMTGIRMLPGTRLAQAHAAAGADLAQPVFYFSQQVSEAWMLRRVNQAIRNQPNVVHAAEEGGSAIERSLHHALYWLGVAPPYWRFLPQLLGFPLLHAVRRNNPSVGVRSREHVVSTH
jgi:hypothetical protein